MIKVEHLTKYYGNFLAVDDLSFTIDEGHVYGFLGPNGAGKTTTMNMMTGCLSATSGRVEVGGFDIFEDARQAKRLIGYLPEQPPLYLSDTPEEYLRFVGEAKGLSGAELEQQVARALEQVRMADMGRRRISALSKGYKQRLGIAQALLGNPEVIILDEPTVGLDPIQIVEIRDLIRQLGQEHTVILSSHILSELHAICEKILIIAHGKLVAFDTPDMLERSLLSAGEIRLTAEAGPEETGEILSALPAAADFALEGREDGTTRARVSVGGGDIYAASREIFFAFARRQRALLELSVKRASLEDVFIELTEGAASGEQAEKTREEREETTK